MKFINKFYNNNQLYFLKPLLIVLGLFMNDVALSQNNNSSIRVKIDNSEIIDVTRAEADVNIKIDGKIDEQEWQSLTVYDPYKVTEPDTLSETTYETKTRFFYTSSGFYFSMEMEQPKNTLVKRFKVRDDWQTQSDKVGFSLDTSGDGKYGYWFSIALGDSEGDGTLMPEKIYTADWDGAWYAATSETENGWSAEFYLPWSQVAMPKDTDDRIINLFSFREVAHLNEQWSWPALPDSS